jgi:hypothetical protein
MSQNTAAPSFALEHVLQSSVDAPPLRLLLTRSRCDLQQQASPDPSRHSQSKTTPGRQPTHVPFPSGDRSWPVPDQQQQELDRSQPRKPKDQERTVAGEAARSQQKLSSTSACLTRRHCQPQQQGIQEAGNRVPRPVEDFLLRR